MSGRGLQKLAFALLLVVASCATESGQGDRAPSGGAPSGDAAKALPQSAATLFVGPRFLTGDPDLPEVDGVSVDASGRIVGLHATLSHAPRIRTITLDGALAVPGLHDAHLHLSGIGQVRESLDLRNTNSIKELVAAVADYAAKHPDLAVIRGRGWDQSRFREKRFPTAQDLAPALGDRLAVLTRVDGHALLASAAVLEKAGITASTAVPEGGRIELGKDGEPTGLLVDNAMPLLDASLPAPSADDKRRWLEDALETCADAGLVAVHDMGMDVETFDALVALATESPLPVRVFVYLDGSAPGSLARLREPGPLPASVALMGVKLFADGAMGSRGAALLEDYADAPGNRGLLLTTPDELQRRVADVQALGHQAAIHAIGDRGNRTALDAIAHAEGDALGARHRIEHAQLVSPDDFATFARLGVVASMQPTHATSDMRWAKDRVGAERLEGAYAWRTFLKNNVPLAFGSDAPVESERPGLGVYAAITRRDADGNPKGGWLPEQKLFLTEALDAFTSGAAYAVKREKELGMLKPGMRFDVTVFDRDPRPSPNDWLTAEVVATVVDGRVRLAAGRTPSPTP